MRQWANVGEGRWLSAFGGSARHSALRILTSSRSGWNALVRPDSMHRHGACVHASRKVVDLQQDDGTVVAKFSKTSEVKLCFLISRDVAC